MSNCTIRLQVGDRFPATSKKEQHTRMIQEAIGNMQGNGKRLQMFPDIPRFCRAWTESPGINKEINTLSSHEMRMVFAEPQIKE